MALLTPDFGLLFWMLISFGTVFFILAKKGFPIIVRMVDKRRDYIQKSLDAADEANRKLENINAQAQHVMDEALVKQAEIIKKAVAESEKIVQNAKTRAEEETGKQLEAARKRIESEKAKVLGEINSQVAVLSCEIAEKILRHELADREHQESLILDMLKESEDVYAKRNAKTQ